MDIQSNMHYITLRIAAFTGFQPGNRLFSYLDPSVGKSSCCFGHNGDKPINAPLW